VTLFILQNNYVPFVLNDLQKICPDPALSVAVGTDPSGVWRDGRVTYSPSSSSTAGCELVAVLANVPQFVGVRGQSKDFYISPSAAGKLESMFGATVYDRYPGAATVEVVYDTTSCNGLGYLVHDSAGSNINYPSEVSLFHELAHARRVIEGRLDGTVDYGGIDDENLFRTQRGLPRRSDHWGACAPPPPAPAPLPRSGCFIATAAFGSTSDPNVAFLREFRDKVLRQTRAGSEFFDRYWQQYYRISPQIVRQMEDSAELREMVRWSLVTPIVNYLKLMVRMPEAPLDDLPETWRGFLMELREELEQWTAEIELPGSFDGMTAIEAAQELAVVLRYVLRRPASRQAYLLKLEEQGELPLKAGSQADEVREILAHAGRPDEELARITGEAPQRSTRVVSLLQGAGTAHVLDRAQINAGEWIYTVTVTNSTPEFFDQVVIFYKRVGLNGVVFLQETGFVPGDIRIFRLGVCKDMESYALGFFQGEDMVARLPDEGSNMTAALASQINPTDTDPCADSWTIS
jgi:hypothetical protein